MDAPPPGLGGSHATFGAKFDGAPIVVPKTLPIATDRWTALYPNQAGGSGCAAAPAPIPAGGLSALGLLGLVLILRRRSR